MPSMCYHSPSARYSAAYEPSTLRKKPDKRRSKNLFKTALDKLTGKHKEKKAASDNVYEVIVIYKDEHDNHEDSDHTIPSSEYTKCQVIRNNKGNVKDETPKAPPRNRSRPHSRNSYKNYELKNQSPTPPPRSRPNSRNSCKNYDFKNRSPTPPPRSRPHSRISCKTYELKNQSPTPPPRSRPQSRRNSCKNSLPKDNKASNYPQDHLQNDKKSDMCKPPIVPLRSPFRKERKLLSLKIINKTKSIRKSVSLTDLESGLDYIDIDEIEDTSNSNNKAIPKNTTSTSKLYNSDDMVACNARMDSRWAKVLNSSSLSLSMPCSVADCVTVQETHLGPMQSQGWSADQRTQSYSGLAGHQLDSCEVPENSLGLLAPKDRVKLSLDRMDIPDWYMDRPHKENLFTTGTNKRVWKKGSFPNIQYTTSKSTPCSPVPPSSPPSSHSKWRNNLRDDPLQTFSPTHTQPQIHSAQHPPYTGWRSQDRLPTFLPTDSPGRVKMKTEEEKESLARLCPDII